MGADKGTPQGDFFDDLFRSFRKMPPQVAEQSAFVTDARFRLTAKLSLVECAPRRNTPNLRRDPVPQAMVQGVPG